MTDADGRPADLRTDLSRVAGFRLEWVSSFVAVARHGSFSAAATSLGRSQPRVSVNIAALESTLGVALFDRSVHPVALTPEGRALLPAAENVIHDLNRLTAAAASTRDSAAGDVRLGLYPSAAVFLLPSLLLRLETAHPLVRLSYIEDASRTLEQHVINADVDLAVRPLLPAVHASRLTSIPLWSEPLVVLTPTNGPFATAPEIDVHDLADTPLITIGTGGENLQYEVHAAFSHVGIRPRIAHQTNQPQTLVSLVRRGLGLGVTNGLAAITANLDGVRLVPLTGTTARREVALWLRTDQPESPARDAVAELIRATPPPRWPSPGHPVTPPNSLPRRRPRAGATEPAGRPR